MAIIIGDKIISGRNLTISNGRIIVDGVDITSGLPDQKTINIQVDGDIETIKADVCQTIKVNGKVGQIQSQSGDVECGDVGGSISTMSGDVDCGNVSGSISTMSGDVKHRRP
jgi:flagellar basal body rod protein FlgF